MDGPEHLDDDPRPTRRRTGAVVVVAVLVVAGLGAVRLTGLLPDAPSRGPAHPPSSLASSPSWPRGAGTGTLYVLDDGGVVTVDVTSGLVQRSPVSVEPSSVVLTAGGLGVVLWFVDGNGTPRLVTPGSPTSPTASGPLARGRGFLPGPDIAVWVSPDNLTDGASRWRLVDVDGTVRTTVRLSGVVESDGSGGLFATTDGRVRHVVPGRPTTTWTGQVTAVGPDGDEAVRCADRRCDLVLHDRVSGSETVLATPSRTDAFAAALSPGNRFIATVRPASAGDDGSPPVVRVSVPGVERELRSFSASEHGSTSLVWLSDRWLGAVGETGLVLYDAVDDRLVTPGLGLVDPHQLVFRPT